MKSQSTPLPLRSSVVWGGFRDAELIPYRYGETGGRLIQYDAARTQFVWADHGCLAVDAVTKEGQEVSNWSWKNTTDVTGHAVTLITFDSPQEEGATLIARGRGKMRPRDGALMTNPAEVVQDVLATIAGRPVTLAQVDAFRRACEREGLSVGGSIEDADTDQTVVRAIVESVGGVYCADMPGLCRLWPGVTGDAPRFTLADGDVTAEADLDDLENDLTIQFGYEDGRPLESIQLIAPESIARHGSRPRTIEARWLTSGRVAAAVGTRLLRQSARPAWAVSAKARRIVAVGESVNVAHPALPVSGPHVILSREVDFDAGTTAYAFRAPAGDAPAVKIARQSSAYDPTQYAGANFTTQGGERIFTLTESDGVTPIAHAKVTLDGGTQVRFTDSTGRVSFPVSSMPIGPHVLDVLTEDGRPMHMQVLVQ